MSTAYGTTVMDFMCETRLQMARDAMDKDGLTIGQAAYLAGYSSPANFSTAFKRVFGMSSLKPANDNRDRNRVCLCGRAGKTKGLLPVFQQKALF
ncbi:helix-turn-helix domain-containing protein [uncultured Thalassospira sp.]|uniref:helix-turn-helix domain-containing protein n=1 Tax=uncultured Thalassospira sp. TaxID=404382 RepID=UPI0030D888B6